MKFTKASLLKAFGVMLLGGLFATSCSNDESNAPSVGQSGGKTVEMTLSASTDLPRLAQYADPTTGKTGQVAMGAADLNIRVAVARDGGVTQYQTLEFKKVAGEARATYTGQVQVPAGGTGNYKINAILLSEVGGEVYTRVGSSSNLVDAIPTASLGLIESGNIVKTKIPYVATVEVPYTTDQKILASSWLSFKASGTLLRMQVTNNSGKAQTLASIKIKTNAFFPAWTYDLSNLTGGNLEFGSTASLDTWEKSYNITPVTLQAGKNSQHYYLWVMPAKASTTLSTEIFAVNSAGESFPALTSTNKLPLGGKKLALGMTTVPTIPNTFPKGKLPFTYFGGFVKSGQSYISADNQLHPINTVNFPLESTYGYWSDTQIMANTIRFSAGYKTPSFSELAAIMPVNEQSVPPKVGYHNVNLLRRTENITVGGETAVYDCEYKGTGSTTKTVYALRFITSDNSRRMAYRYEMEQKTAKTPIVTYMRLSMKYVGNDKSINNVDDLIAKEPKFWDDAEMLYFPAYGMRSATGSMQNYGVVCQVYSTDRVVASTGTDPQQLVPMRLGATDIDQYPKAHFTGTNDDMHPRLMVFVFRTTPL